MSITTDHAALDERMSSLHPMLQKFKTWLQEKGPWFATSLTAHAVILVAAALILNLLGVGILAKKVEGPEFKAEALAPSDDIKIFKLGESPLDPTKIDLNDLAASPPPGPPDDVHTINEPAVDPPGGGMPSERKLATGIPGDLNSRGLGLLPGMLGTDGIGVPIGTGNHPGSGGAGSGFGGRGKRHGDGIGGCTIASEHAVAAAVNWLARHQNPDGSWSMHGFSKNCKGAPCDDNANGGSNAVATAFGLLPFLGAGQTHLSKGPYQTTIRKGVTWLITHQQPNGCLCETGTEMYTHGICTIALCECFGMSDDSTVGLAAQKAIQYIEAAQDKAGGGWRYAPQQPGDTSVSGWQIMALKSGLMAGLKVKPEALKGAGDFLASVELKTNNYGGLYGYTTPGRGLRTTAIGALCTQYLGKTRDDPALTEGVRYLMANMPSKGPRDCYYWYYATQVMHNMQGVDWDAWNRQMRKILIDTQTKEGCASGSWDPDLPTKDAYGGQGGRMMVTSLSCLTLEVYYRYSALYRPYEAAKAAR